MGMSLKHFVSDFDFACKLNDVLTDDRKVQCMTQLH